MQIEIVDSHQHFWQVGRFDYPWMSSEVEVLYQDYLPPRLEPIRNDNNVGQTVLVQASDSVEETRWLLSLADQYSFIAGVVGWVDLKSSAVDQQLEEFTAHPKFKGVRHLVESEPADDWLAEPAVINGLQRLGAHGVSYDLLAHTKHLPYAKTAVESCPEVSFVLNHMAKPPIASREITEWEKAFKEIAAYPNVSCKLSGLVTEADWAHWRVDDLRPFVEVALAHFGPRRLMFGSDWPVCLLAASYRQVLESYGALTDGLGEEDRERIFRENAREFYRL